MSSYLWPTIVSRFFQKEIRGTLTTAVCKRSPFNHSMCSPWEKKRNSSEFPIAQPPQSPLSRWKVAAPGCCGKQWRFWALIFGGTYDSKKLAFYMILCFLQIPSSAHCGIEDKYDLMNDQDSTGYVIQQHMGRAKPLEYLPSRTTAWPICAIWLLAHQYSLQHAQQNVKRWVCQTWGSGFHGFWWTMTMPMPLLHWRWSR